MDTLKYDEELRQLFRQLPIEKPANGFSARVMTQVVFEAQRVAHRERALRIAWAVSIPCLIALLSVVGYFTRDYWIMYLVEFFEPLSISMRNTVSSIVEIFSGSGNRVVLPGLLFLALLLGDLFIRRYMERKKWTNVYSVSSASFSSNSTNFPDLSD